MTEKPIIPDTSGIDASETETVENAEFRRIAERRHLLMLGAAGLPMMLTMKASAREVLISQLTCTVKLPRRMRILVDCDGVAWVGTKNIQYKNGKGFKVAHITRFKDNASYQFPAGTVPNDWRPDVCPIEECNNDDDDDDDYDYDYASASAELDELMRASMSDQADGIMLAAARKGDDDDDDDDCDEDWIDSGYAFYNISKNTVITPADHISGNSWNVQNNNNGLYIVLSLAYESSHGNTAGWPGISCIFSILTYLQTQS